MHFIAWKTASGLNRNDPCHRVGSSTVERQRVWPFHHRLRIPPILLVSCPTNVWCIGVQPATKSPPTPNHHSIKTRNELLQAFERIRISKATRRSKYHILTTKKKPRK